MQEQRAAALRGAGIDVDAALERMMNNDMLLERFLGKFLADANYGRLTAALDAGDADAAVTASHTLKGVCGNLSMTVLFGLLTKQVAALRAGDMAGAKALMADITPAYESVCAAIRG